MKRQTAFIAVMVLYGTVMIAQNKVIPVLDLTKSPLRDQQITSVPGMSVGGIEGQAQEKSFRLPLRVTLISIIPRPSRLGDRFTVEVYLRNIDTSTFFLPASQSGIEVFEKDGNDRRSFNFNLIFQDPKTGRKASTVAAVVMGSSTAKDSLLRIGPGEKVRVLFKGNLSAIADWLGHDLKQIQIRVGVSEKTFEDRRYFLKNKSEEVVSANAETIVLRDP